MNERIEYGLPTIFVLEVDSDGINQSQTTTMTSYDSDNRIISLTDAVTIQSVDYWVVIHKENESKFVWGKLTDDSTVSLSEDASCYWIEDSVTAGDNVVIYAGMGLCNFDEFTVVNSESGQSYKGKYAFDKEWQSTDADITVNINTVLFFMDFVEMVNGVRSSDFGKGKVLTINDFNIDTDKEARPRDVSILAMKRKKDNDDEWETLYLPRVKASDLTIPTQRDAYTTQDYSFGAYTKSLANGDVVTYTV